MRELGKSIFLLATAGMLGASPSLASDRANQNDQTVFYDQNGLTLRWHFQGGIYVATEGNIFWNLPAVTAPGSGYDPDKSWQEFYIKPGVSFEYTLYAGASLYGKLSAVSSYTARTDPFDQGNIGATTIEEAYLGLRGETKAGSAMICRWGPES